LNIFFPAGADKSSNRRDEIDSSWNSSWNWHEEKNCTYRAPTENILRRAHAETTQMVRLRN
jgi:hypothetical protein